jgi:trehalose-6-phosphate synthase
MRSMRRRVRDHDVAHWAAAFLDALDEAPGEGQLTSAS